MTAPSRAARPNRPPITGIHLACAFLALLLVIGLCFGADIDRRCIIGGLLFALCMSGGIQLSRAKAGEELDG